jgi:hypothetical protein
MLTVFTSFLPLEGVTKEFYASGEFLRVLGSLEPRIFEIDRKWNMSVAYYLPRGCASMLVVEAQKIDCLSCVDIWLNTFIRRGFFPNVLIDGHGVSQCESQPSDLAADLYMNKQGKSMAQKFGANVAIGMSAPEFAIELRNALVNSVPRT